MDARYELEMVSQDQQSEENEGYEIDYNKVNRAFRKIGAEELLFNPPTEAQYNYLCHKKLSVLQWRLLELFKLMFDEELRLCKDEYDVSGVGTPIRTLGGHLKDRMNNYPQIAEEVLSHWANRLGINHLYADSLGTDHCDVHELHGKIYKNSSGVTVYERLYVLLRKLV